MTYLALSDITDVASAVLSEGDDGRRGSLTFRVLDDSGSVGLHDGAARVRGSEFDSDDTKDEKNKRLGEHIILIDVFHSFCSACKASMLQKRQLP